MLVDHDIDAGIVEFDPATGGAACKLCSIPFNSKFQWTDHQRGKKHFKRLSTEERRRRKRRRANVQKLGEANVPATSISQITRRVWPRMSVFRCVGASRCNYGCATACEASPAALL